MSGMQECGCYDGVWSPDDDTLVAVRCDKHVGVAAPAGAVPMRVDDAGRAVIWQAYIRVRARHGPAMAGSIKSRRR